MEPPTLEAVVYLLPSGGMYGNGYNLIIFGSVVCDQNESAVMFANRNHSSSSCVKVSFVPMAENSFNPIDVETS